MLYDKAQAFHLAFVFRAALHNIDTGRIDAGVAKEVSQLCYVLFQLVEGNGEQVPEIMRKNFTRLHTGGGTQFPHFLPDIGTVQGLAILCNEYRPTGDIRFLAVGLQRPPKLLWNQYDPLLAFAVYNGTPIPQRLHSDILKFRHPNAGSGQRLHQVKQAQISPRPRRVEKAHIFFSGQFPFFIAVNPPLGLDLLDVQIGP